MGSLNVVPSRYIGGTFTTNSNYPPSNGFTDTSLMKMRFTFKANGLH